MPARDDPYALSPTTPANPTLTAILELASTTHAARAETAAAAGQDPLLDTLRALTRERDDADRSIRRLLAYARATHPTYRLADLAAATGMSISGVTTAYGPDDAAAIHHLTRCESD